MRRLRVASHLAPHFGAFSPAVQIGRQVFVSAQLPAGADGRLAGGDLTEQIRRSLENIRLQLEVVGLSLDDVARLTIYVADELALDKIDEALLATFVEPLPACSVVGVAALPHGAAVTVEAVAVRY
jgi:enamine deaminase RidA (YjgF/YER057c/UK114 family)